MTQFCYICSKNNKFSYTKYIVKNINIDDIDHIFEKYINNHNQKVVIFYNNCQFVIQFKNNIFATIQINNLERRTNTRWNYEILDQNGSDLLSSLIVPRSSGMYSGGLINKQDDTRACLLLFSGRMISDDAYIKLERRDIHNIKHIKIVYSRPNIDNTSGRFTISLLNNSNIWVEVLKFDNNEKFTDEFIWGDEDIDVSFKNYGIILKYDNVKSNKQDMAISRIILTNAV